MTLFEKLKGKKNEGGSSGDLNGAHTDLRLVCRCTNNQVFIKFDRKCFRRFGSADLHEDQESR